MTYYMLNHDVPGECIPGYRWTELFDQKVYRRQLADLQDAATCGRPLESLVLQRIERAMDVATAYWTKYLNQMLYGDDHGSF